jgi:hypothetical protein
MIAPMIAGQVVPMLACAKNYPAAGMGSGSFNATYKIIDGVVTITDQTDQSVINNFRVWHAGVADVSAIPGLSFTITNTNSGISSTDDVDATEFNLGDSFALAATAGTKMDRLFITDSDRHKIKVIRPYANIDNWAAGDTRWDVPGQSDSSPGQTYVLATVGGENSFTVWASQDSLRWTEVQNLNIAGPTDRYYELDRFTKVIRFGDNIHGAIPDALAFIRVRYEESVDQAEFGSLGSSLGDLTYPRGVAAAWNSNLGHYDVYVCDTGNDRIQKFVYNENSVVDPNGWGTPLVSWSAVENGTDLISSPEDIEVVTYDNETYLVVSDAGNDRIVIFKDTEATGSGGNAAPEYYAKSGGTGTQLNEWIDCRGLGVMAEDSGLVIMATDGDRDVVAKLVSRDWLTTSEEDSGGSSDPVEFALSLEDLIDNDGHLLLQPGARRTIRLAVRVMDSLVSLNVQCAFDTSMISIISINEGNLWSGESFTSKPFFATIDNTDGTFQVSTSMVGDANGLTTAGQRTVATVIVEAKQAMVIPSEGQISYASFEMRNILNIPMDPVQESMTLHGGYLADIAADNGDPGSTPTMTPEPDGRINFADVNIFTQGWNGDGLTYDPLADIGPYSGSSLPNLISEPDGQMNSADLLALETMYDWYAATTPELSIPGNPLRSNGALDANPAITVAARPSNDGWLIELQARDISDLSSAHLYLEVANTGAMITAVRQGDFLSSGGNAIFLHTRRTNVVDISMGRLNRDEPTVSGSGILATIELSTPNTNDLDIRLAYELRDDRNGVIDAAGLRDSDVEPIPTSFSLASPYPNPFNATTTFTLHIAQAAPVKLSVFNVLGQQVATILNRPLQAGAHRILWEARADNGVALGSGVYFVQLESIGNLDVQKVVLLR